VIVVNNHCRYFQQTFRGKRCVFVDVGDWQKVKGTYLEYCRNGGAGCPVYALVNTLLSANSNKLGRKGDRENG